MKWLFCITAATIIIGPDIGSAENQDPLSGDSPKENCNAILVGAESFVEQLAKMAISENTGPQYQELFQRAQAELAMSDSNLHEAIELQALLLKSQDPTHAYEPIEKGKVEPRDFKYIEAAYNYARENVLSIQPAFMKAIHEKRMDVIRGLLIMNQNSEELCTEHPGVVSFCKNLDFASAWQGKNFLAEAANESLQIARFLIENGASAPIKDLVGTTFGPDVALILISKEHRPTVSDALSFKDDRVTLALLKTDIDFTIADIEQIIKEDRYDLFKEVIQKHPILTEQIDANLFASTITHRQMDFFNALLELKPERAGSVAMAPPHFAEMTRYMYPLDFAAAANNIEAAKILLEKYKVNPAEVYNTGRQEYYSMPLIFAATHEDTTILKMLLADKRTVINQTEARRQNALHQAIFAFCNQRSTYSNEAIVELILAGVNVEVAARTSYIVYLNPARPDEETETPQDQWTPLKILNYFILATDERWPEPQKSERLKALVNMREILKANRAQNGET